MDKTNGRVQILGGRLFFSPNCSRTVALPPPARDKNNCEHNIFLPSLQPGVRSNYFELDIATYAIPRWWSLIFGWIAFFPLRPSFTGPIFEKLVMPGPYYAFDEERNGYSMPSGLCDKWLQVDNDLSNAVQIICDHYHSIFIYPLRPLSFGFSRTHPRSGALHMSLRKSKDWFVVWMALLSAVIAHADDTYRMVKDSAKPGWHDLLLQHFNPQWLDALLASTVLSFSPDTPRTGVFLELSEHDLNRPPPEYFCQFHVPVWYPWSAEIASQPQFAYLAPLPYQLQEGTTFMTRSPHPPSPTPLPPSPTPVASQPLPAASAKPKSAWLVFFTRRRQQYEERLQKETPKQQQIRLERLRNPPKVSAKVFEWLVNDKGELFREAVPKKMREDVLGNYPDRQIYYDPIENEYDCCEEYDSGAPGEPFDDNDSDYAGENEFVWGDNDVDVGRLGDDRLLPARAPSPDIQVDDDWRSSMTAPDPWSSENIIAEIHRILYLYYGYTPHIPIPQFQDPVLESESDMRRFVRFLGMTWDGLPLSAFETDQISAAATFVNQLCTKGSSISAAIWDLCRENRQSVLFSARLNAVRPVGENLFMFDFDKDSTVKWKLTVTTPAHALLLCRLDPQLDEIGLARYLLENGIPFHTLQASTTLSRSPLSNHPPLVIPTRNADYEFSWRDYEAFRQQCHVIFKQARGRAALLKGYYPWRLAINDIGFSSALSGPSGLSTKSEEMLVVRLPETGEEFVDDKLTDIELNLISGQYVVSTSMYVIGGFFDFANNSLFRRSKANIVVVMVSSTRQI
jgi:hypothetical protein